MKTKLLTICLLLFTSQVFAEQYVCSYVSENNYLTTIHFTRELNSKNIPYFSTSEHGGYSICREREKHLILCSHYESLLPGQENVMVVNLTFIDLQTLKSSIWYITSNDKKSLSNHGKCVLIK